MGKKLKIIITVAILIGAGVFFYLKFFNKSSSATTYQTAMVEKGTIVVSTTVSGTVATANSAEVRTEASGVVKKIYVENGQTVTAGTAIAELDLDIEGQQRNIQAWSSYQSAQNQLYSLQSSMLSKWKTYMEVSQSSTYQNSDGSPKTDYRALPQFVSLQDDWLATEAQYKNQQNLITSSYLSYQQTSSVIYAPISGTLTGFSLQVGSVITAQSNSSGGSSAQKIASIITKATPTVKVNLTEVDVPKVKIGNKVTVTFDAFSGQTFTGSIISIDTVGSVSSGVTTYPAIIKLDTDRQDILTNMSATANILIDSKTDVLKVSTAAISNGTVKVMKNGTPTGVNVETGISSSTETEITSGLSEGDVVVTGTSTSAKSTSTSSTSVFGGFGGGARVIGR